MAKPPTSPFMREKKPVPLGRGSLTGNDGLEVACPPLSVTAGPRTGQDVAENAAGRGSYHLLASSHNTGKGGLESKA